MVAFRFSSGCDKYIVWSVWCSLFFFVARAKRERVVEDVLENLNRTGPTRPDPTRPDPPPRRLKLLTVARFQSSESPESKPQLNIYINKKRLQLQPVNTPNRINLSRN